MEQRLITIPVHRRKGLGKRWRRKMAKQRAIRLWYASAAVLLLVYCWRVAGEKSLETDPPEQIASGSVVQVLRLEEEAASRPADTGLNPMEPAQVNEIRDCIITYFCAERYPHICGTGDGITATGAIAQPGITCAVDPAVIPLGSTVLVDFGDNVLHTYRAEDVGGAVEGNHVDLCVASYQEAEDLGIAQATVYWEEARS